MAVCGTSSKVMSSISTSSYMPAISMLSVEQLTSFNLRSSIAYPYSQRQAYLETVINLRIHKRVAGSRRQCVET